MRPAGGSRRVYSSPPFSGSPRYRLHRLDRRVAEAHRLAYEAQAPTSCRGAWVRSGAAAALREALGASEFDALSGDERESGVSCLVGHACKLDLNRPSPADPVVRSMAEAAPRAACLDVRLLDYIAVVLLPRVREASEVAEAWLNERWRGLVGGAEARWDRLRPWRVGDPAPLGLRGTGVARFAAAALWLAREDGPPRWLVELAEFVWRAEVAPGIRARRAAPAPALWSGLILDRRSLRNRAPASLVRVEGAGSWELVTESGATLALFVGDGRAEMARLRRGALNERAGLVLERIWRALPRMAVEQYIRGVPVPTQLVFSTLAEFGGAVGISSARDVAKILDVLEMMESWRGHRHDLPSLLDYEYVPRKHLIVTVLRGLSYALQETKNAPVPKSFGALRELRMLLPILDVPDLSFVSPDKYEAVCWFQTEVLLNIRARVHDYPGGFVLRDEEIGSARRESGLSEADARRALARACAPGGWLRRADTGRGVWLVEGGAHRLYLEAATMVGRSRKPRK